MLPAWCFFFLALLDLDGVEQDEPEGAGVVDVGDVIDRVVREGESSMTIFAVEDADSEPTVPSVSFTKDPLHFASSDEVEQSKPGGAGVFDVADVVDCAVREGDGESSMTTFSVEGAKSEPRTLPRSTSFILRSLSFTKGPCHKRNASFILRCKIRPVRPLKRQMHFLSLLDVVGFLPRIEALADLAARAFWSEGAPTGLAACASRGFKSKLIAPIRIDPLQTGLLKAMLRA